MNEQYNAVIQRKLALLDNQVGKLRLHLEQVTPKQFVADWVIVHSIATKRLTDFSQFAQCVAEKIETP